MKKPKYHQSEIKDALKCGKYWVFRYLDKLPSPSKSAAAVGNVVDATANHLMRQKRDGMETTIEEALDIASTEFEARRPDTQWDEPPDEMKGSALSIVKLFQIQVLPGIQPRTVQEEFVVEPEGKDYLLGGTFDYTDVRNILGDVKTASPSRASQYTTTGALQPAIYWYAYTALNGREPDRFQFDIMTRVTSGSPAYKPVSGQVSQADLSFTFETIDAVHKMITSGVALPAPEGSWWCSKKWCPYWDRCKGKK